MYGSYLGQEGYRANSETRLSRFGATGNIHLGDDSGIQTIAALQIMPRAQNPSTLDAEAASENPRQVRDAVNQFNTGKEAAQGQLGATYYNEVGIGQLRTTAYGIFRELENPIPFGYIDLSRRVAGARVTLESSRDRSASALEWGAGVEGKTQRDDRSEFGNDGGNPTDVRLDQLETVDNAGIFGRASFPLGAFRINAGVRYDVMQFEADDRLGSNDGTRTFDTLSPSLGVSVDVGTTRLFANLASGLEAPTANELSNRPGGGTGFNPNLDPENIWGLEAGVQGVWVSQSFSYDLAVFGTRVTDLLVPQQGADEQTFFRNAGETRHAGVETAVRWAPLSALGFRASYTYVNAEFTDAQTADGTSLNGNEIPGVPPHMFSGSAEIQQESFTMTVRVNGLSSHKVNSLNTASNDGYALLDLEAGIPLSFEGITASPFAAIHNVFDTRYNDTVINAFGSRYYEPAAGRTYRLGVAVSIK
jgi:iron complex outermembrane receptor protein